MTYGIVPFGLIDGIAIFPEGPTIGQTIANGHAYDKHVVAQNEYPDMNFGHRAEFGAFIDKIIDQSIATGSNAKGLSGGRTAYWDDVTSTVVIYNPNAVDFGTAFRPLAGKAYYHGLH